MKRVLLLQLDGKWPSVAVMRVSTFHKERGDEVVFRRVVTVEGMDALTVRFEGRDAFTDQFDVIYASLIFSKTRPVAELLQQSRPDAHIGGTGWDDYTTTPKRITSLEEIGIFTRALDYSLYPNFLNSIGYTQRGCRLKCEFCVVSFKEGAVQTVATVEEIWRGDPYPRNLLLFDNDFFGQRNWRDQIAAMRVGNYKVCFNQGVNARMLNDEAAAALASIQYYDDDFKTKRIYTAWDSRPDERVLFRGLNALKRHGVRPDDIMVYMLIGFKDDWDVNDWEYRRQRIRQWGARPYPMPYVRNYLSLGYQRWCMNAYDKKISWAAWQQAKMQPANLGARSAPALFTMR